VFDRIVVYVIDVTFQVNLIPDLVFPITTLPDPTFTLGAAARAYRFIFGQAAGESRLDLRPAHGEVRVARWQLPNYVQVFGQYHHGRDGKGMVLSGLAYAIAEYIDVPDQEVGVSIG
jgi:hypothetical protein